MSDFQWVSTGSLGSIIAGDTSEFYVSLSTSSYNISYKILSGEVPTGLELNRDGTISGIVNQNTQTTSTNYSFLVGATDVYGNVLTSSTFSIQAIQNTSTQYTSISCRPFLSTEKRVQFKNFISDQTIFPPDYIFRPLDPNFGIKNHFTMVIDFGIEKLSPSQYYSIITRNFYKRRFTLGNVKSIASIDGYGNKKYEMLYIEVIDKYENQLNQSIPDTITISDVEYYPGSVSNMRNRLRSQANYTDELNPDFNSQYFKFVPLCYIFPNKSSTILRRISSNGIKFNTFDFEIDRIIARETTEDNRAKYLILNRNYPLA